MKRWFAVFLVALLGVAHADDPPLTAPGEDPARLQLRVHLEPTGTLVQGETARLVVDILTPEFFHEAPDVPELRADGMYIALTDESGVHPSASIHGQNWTGVQRIYLVTPLAGGSLHVPAISVSASLGAQGDAVSASAPPMDVRVQAVPLPPGVTEALIASQVTLSQTVTPSDSGLRVGQSITRTIVISADGAPAMMIPPLAFAPIDGLAVYTAPATTRNATGKQGGFLGGERVETVTYRIERRGRYTLPPVRVRWMDAHSRTWRESSLPEVRFHAWRGALSQQPFALPNQTLLERLVAFVRSDLGALVIVLIALGVIGWFFRARLQTLRTRLHHWREQRRMSEAAGFRQLRRLSSNASAAQVYAAVDAWVRRTAHVGGPDTLQSWARRYGDDACQVQVRGLLASVYGATSAPGQWTRDGLLQGLGEARKRWRAHPAWYRKASLPPLNP